MVKIGIGTKGGNFNYERIKQHQNTYGKVFDLKNSYELLAPPFFSITALERSIKDFTYSYIPPKDVMAKYAGKEGHTEIRTLASLDSILKYIELQTLNVDLKLKHGINLLKHKKEVVSKKFKQPIKKAIKEKIKSPILEKETIEFPFAFINQKHKIELVLNYSYIPNLNKINCWSFDESPDIKLKIEANKSFLKDIYLYYPSWTLDENEPWKRANEVDLCLYHSVWKKGMAQFKPDGRYINSITVYTSTLVENNKDRVIIEFSLQGVERSSETYKEYSEWFKKQFIEPLIEKALLKKVAKIII